MILPHFWSLGWFYRIFTGDLIGPGCERVGAVKRAKIWEMIIDAPEDLHSEDVMKDSAASNLQSCFLALVFFCIFNLPGL